MNLADYENRDLIGSGAVGRRVGSRTRRRGTADRRGYRRGVFGRDGGRLATVVVIEATMKWRVTRRDHSDVSMEELPVVVAAKHSAAAIA